jgi:hypothetical protein
MPEKYIHYFGNESCEDLLEAYDIVPKNNGSVDVLSPKICPNCNEGNTQDAKFCSKCKMIMSYEGYQEALDSQSKKEDELKVMKEQLDPVQSQMQSLMSAFSNMKEQPQVDSMAKTLYSSGLLIKATDNNNNAKEQLIKAAGKAAYHATRTKSVLTREAEKAKAKGKT